MPYSPMRRHVVDACRCCGCLAVSTHVLNAVPGWQMGDPVPARWKIVSVCPPCHVEHDTRLLAEPCIYVSGQVMSVAQCGHLAKIWRFIHRRIVRENPHATSV